MVANGKISINKTLLTIFVLTILLSIIFTVSGVLGVNIIESEEEMSAPIIDVLLIDNQYVGGTYDEEGNVIIETSANAVLHNSVEVADGGYMIYQPKTNTVYLKDATIDVSNLESGIEVIQALTFALEGKNQIILGENNLKDNELLTYKGNGSLALDDINEVVYNGIYFMVESNAVQADVVDNG